MGPARWHECLVFALADITRGIYTYIPRFICSGMRMPDTNISCDHMHTFFTYAYFFVFIKMFLLLLKIYKMWPQICYYYAYVGVQFTCVYYSALENWVYMHTFKHIISIVHTCGKRKRSLDFLHRA